MPDPVSELVERGRQLAPADRERLVDRLLESLNEPAAVELDAAWEAEIEHRLAEYDRGSARAVDSEEVFCQGPTAREVIAVRFLPSAQVDMIFRG